MNFKDFIECRLCEEQDIEAFKRSAYRRVFPNGRETDPNKMWSAVLAKASYKLTKNSKKETRTAVSIAKGAQSRAKTLGIKTDTVKTELPVSDKIAAHLENWSDDDIAELKQNTDNELIANCNTLDDLKNVLDSASDEEKSEILSSIEKSEQDVDEISWDDAETPGTEVSTEVKPDTDNTDALTKIQDKQKQDRIAKKIQDNNIPTKSDGTPDFDNEETLKKINELMINGDEDLFNEYILTQGVEKTDLVKAVQDRVAKEDAIKRTELENREIRYQTEKDTKSALAGTAVVLDTVLSFFNGKEENAFTTLAQRRTQAKAIEHALADQFESEIGDKLKQQEKNHATELDSIDVHTKLRLKQIEELKTDPLQTESYKRKYMELTQTYKEQKKRLEEKAPEIQSKLEQRNKLEAALFKLTNSGELDLETIKTVIPQNENESDAEYTERIKSEDGIKQLEQIKDSIASEVEEFNTVKQNIDKEYTDSVNALKDDPDVKNDLKNVNTKYEFLKANINAEAERLKAKENKRYEDFKRVNKQIKDDIPRFCKNLSTLVAWASDPETIQCSELAQRNAKMKSIYGMIGQEWDEASNPTTLEGMKKFVDSRKEAQSMGKFGSKGKSKYGFDDDDFSFGSGSTSKSLKAKSKGFGFDDDFDDFGPGALKPSLKNKDVTSKSLKTLGLKDSDVPKGLKNGSKQVKNLDDYAEYLKDPEHKDELKTVLSDLEQENTEKTPAKKKESKEPEKENQEKKSGDVTGDNKKPTKDVGDKESVDTSTKDEKPIEKVDDRIHIKFDPDTLKGIKVSDDKVRITKDNLKKYKGRPEVLKAFSKDQTDEISVNDVKDEDPTKLTGLSLKTLWEKLNKAGISIRTLPGYQSDMDEQEKKQLIIDYMKKNRSFFDKVLKGINESHRVTFGSMVTIPRGVRIESKGVQRQFSALLENDFKQF